MTTEPDPGIGQLLHDAEIATGIHLRKIGRALEQCLPPDGVLLTDCGPYATQPPENAMPDPTAPPADVPIWQQPPTPWRIADAWAEHLVDRLLTDVPALGTDRPGIARHGVELVYTCEGRPVPHSLAICIHADLDGFLVNAYDAGRHFGPDLLPLSEHGLGLRIPNRIHPRHGDTWSADIYPRLRDAVALAAEAVTAVRDGNTCPSAAGIGEHEYPCRRPTGHATLHPGTWAEHANSSISWTADRITSSHPKAVVLR